jgi:hypothetical protein
MQTYIDSVAETLARRGMTLDEIVEFIKSEAIRIEMEVSDGFLNLPSKEEPMYKPQYIPSLSN